MKEEDHFRDLRGVKRRDGNETYLHGPMDYAKTLKLRFRAGGLNLPERRKRYTSSREEGEEDAQIVPLWQSNRAELT